VIVGGWIGWLAAGVGIVTIVALALLLRSAMRDLRRSWARERELLGSIEKANEIAAREHKRAHDFFRIIEGIEKEAESWRDAYEELFRGAQVAQDMLVNQMNALALRNEMLVKRLRKGGQEAEIAEVNKELLEKLAAFKAQRRDIARAAGRLEAEKVQAAYDAEAETGP